MTQAAFQKNQNPNAEVTEKYTPTSQGFVIMAGTLVWYQTPISGKALVGQKQI